VCVACVRACVPARSACTFDECVYHDAISHVYEVCLMIMIAFVTSKSIPVCVLWDLFAEILLGHILEQIHPTTSILDYFFGKYTLQSSSSSKSCWNPAESEYTSSGLSTLVPIFCLICTITSELNSTLDLAENNRSFGMQMSKETMWKSRGQNPPITQRVSSS